ncbi:MAG: class D beta-lactamase [Myxococcales bacterium]|nr:MAG: class D beta-lactamase [Myxococcales bacterium]
MRSLLLGSLLWLTACGAASPPAAAPSAAKAEAVAAGGGAEPPKPGRPAPLPEAASAFSAARVTGTLALYDSKDGVVACSDAERCESAVTPASTFKIAHSMIALEVGVVEGPDTILPWDKQQYWNEAWNRDLSLRDAFRFSCLPCYRAIARQVGEAAEHEWLHKLGYGNESTGGGADKFWMDGGLLISPLQQIDFLRRFDAGKLPISERTADLVRDIMTLDVTETYVLRGKTGTTLPPEESKLVAWFVGWLEVGERRVYFATLIDGAAPGVDPMQVRRPLTESVLRSRGLM